jgi:hypothetical protein
MNPFSDYHPNEEILRQERLHAGIFALPVVLFAAFLIPTIPLLFSLNMMGNMIGQLNPQGSRSALSILWLVLVAMDLVPALLYFIVILLAYQIQAGTMPSIPGENPLIENNNNKQQQQQQKQQKRPY